MGETHHLKAESLQSLTEVTSPTLSVLVDKIRLTDKVSEAERAQMLRWAKERFDELWASIENPSDIIVAAKEELSTLLSPEALQVILEILSNIP